MTRNLCRQHPRVGAIDFRGPAAVCVLLNILVQTLERSVLSFRQADFTRLRALKAVILEMLQEVNRPLRCDKVDERKSAILV